MTIVHLRIRAIGRAVLACSVTVLLFAPLGSAAPQDDLRRAVALEDAGDYAAAIAAYEGLLAEEPADRCAAVSAFAIANIQLSAMHDVRGAEAAFQRVTRDYPQSTFAAESARRRGACFDSLESWSAAAGSYREALEVAQRTGTATPAWVNEVSLAAANAYYQLGEREHVIETLAQVLAKPLPALTRATVIFRLADSYESSDKPDSAAHYYAELLREHPYSPFFRQAMDKRELINAQLSFDWTPYDRFTRLMQAYGQRNFPEVIAESDTLLALSPPPALANLAQYRRIVAETYSLHDFAAGALSLQALVDQAPEPDIYPRWAIILPHFRETASLGARVMADSNDVSARRQLGVRYAMSAMPVESIAELERVRTRVPDDGEALLYLGYGYQALGDVARAQDAFEACLRVDADNVAALQPLGTIHLQAGRTEQAIECFRKCVEVFPDDANALETLGEAYAVAGQHQAAAEAYRQALLYSPDSANAFFGLGEAQQQLGHRDDAIRSYQRFLELAPGDPRAADAQTALTELGGN